MFAVAINIQLSMMVEVEVVPCASCLAPVMEVACTGTRYYCRGMNWFLVFAVTLGFFLSATRATRQVQAWPELIVPRVESSTMST